MKIEINNLDIEKVYCSKSSDMTVGTGINQFGIENGCLKVSVDNTHYFNFTRTLNLDKGNFITISADIIPISGKPMYIAIFKNSITNANRKLLYTPRENEIKNKVTWLIEENGTYIVTIGYATADEGSCYLRNASFEIENKTLSSAWTDIPLLTNWERNSDVDPSLQYKIINNQVFLRGVIKYTQTSEITNNNICTLPKEITPASIYDSGFLQLMSDGTLVNIQRKDRALKVRRLIPSEGTQNQWLAINLNYSLD